jgi:hypothetical protein
MKNFFPWLILIFIVNNPLHSQSVTVSIDASVQKKMISPYIYGKNNSLSGNPSDPLTNSEWQLLRDMGITMFRENGGNNASKYNWRRKLSSHPDWYNNVYGNNWDFAASSLGTNLPYAQGMWAFQLMGKAAKTTGANFNDWGYNGSAWWSGCGQNLAGGGTVNPAGGSKALVDGNPDLYLENWNADSTTAILNHWFGNNGLGLDPEKIRYWSMDNEPEIWNGTHDDVWKTQPSAEEFVQMYFAVAKKARALYPDIKLVGPVPCNEWFWYTWNGGKISYKGSQYTWLEYFIRRIAEEQAASGMRLLDVIDIHFYPGEKSASDITQLHRIFFDTSYNYPGANGVKTSGSGGWDNSITKEYIFKRCTDWLVKYIGPDHGVTFSLSEVSLAQHDNPNLTANWYASMLGEFARQGVEIFTPWDWFTGMSEVVHLYTHYGMKNYIPAVSTDEYNLSGYPTINDSGDSITLFLVNRDLTQTRETEINLSNFHINGNYALYTLAGLPATETFQSHTVNALKKSDIQANGNSITVSLPPLSVSALVLVKSTVYDKWRSSLYPVNWTPAYKDGEGRFLHDFSYAGYHKGELSIPHRNQNILDVTLPPYSADNTGNTDVTAIIQKALDDAGEAGGGIVYLPAGKYSIGETDTTWVLRISHDSTLMRGAGTGLTFLLNTRTNMRYKDVIQVKRIYGSWFYPKEASSLITMDLTDPVRAIPVESVAGFHKGDPVVVMSTPTDAFIQEHQMTGLWMASGIKGVAFMRRIDSIDTHHNILFIDVPTRYPLKTRDLAKVYKIEEPIKECGIENISIGNIEHNGSGWEDEDYSTPGTGAYDVHNSHIIQLINSENCWIRNVRTYHPEDNTGDFNLLSNGIKLNQCRFVTVDSCDLEKPQYEGGGGNGYMYTIESNDCLIQNSRANDGRHNYDFKYPYSNGNVILKCRGENSKYASDFHMYLSMSNLIDACTFDKDFFESTFRPYGNPLHGYTSSQSVFYNTTGEAYPDGNPYLIESKQFGNGYIIGTSGPAFEVNVEPVQGTMNGYDYNTSPRDFKEGIGNGDYLEPSSLYTDQLSRRRTNKYPVSGFTLKIITLDAQTRLPIEGSIIKAFSDSLVTDQNGIVEFSDMPELIPVKLMREHYLPFPEMNLHLLGDSTITLLLTLEQFDVSINVLKSGTTDPLSNATFTLGTSSQATNTAGKSVFSNILRGSIPYSITKTYYASLQGDVNISSDTSLTFYMIKTEGILRIRLRDGNTPVYNAFVIVNDDTLTSSAIGDAVFSPLQLNGSYSYRVIKTGYQEVTGSVMLTNDTLVLVAMIPVIINSEDGSAVKGIQIWPNPANDRLHFTTGDGLSGGTIEIMNMQGMVLYKIINITRESEIDIHSLTPGTYIFRFRSQRDVFIANFVKN